MPPEAVTEGGQQAPQVGGLASFNVTSEFVILSGARLQALPGSQGPLQLADVFPPTPNVPTLQSPVQVALVMAAVEPYCPAAHKEHTPAPAKLYLPAGHNAAVALVLPGGQA